MIMTGRNIHQSSIPSFIRFLLHSKLLIAAAIADSVPVNQDRVPYQFFHRLINIVLFVYTRLVWLLEGTLSSNMALIMMRLLHQSPR
jgi:hypothetical protein